MIILKILSIFILLNNIVITPNSLFINHQTNQVIYALNEVANTNLVKENQEVHWPTLKRVQSSYVLIRQKPDGTFYVQVTIRGQLAYGGILKYMGKEGQEYKYKRIDGTADDFIFVNYQLNVLSSTQQYDESIVMKMLNFKTSYGLFMKF